MSIGALTVDLSTSHFEPEVILYKVLEMHLSITKSEMYMLL